MRRTILCVFAAGLMVVPPSGAVADEEWRSTPSGWATGPIDHVKTIPFEAGSAMDAVLHRRHLYTTSWRSFSIYDVANPLDPKLLSQTPVPGQLINENPQTNGKILLLSNDSFGRTLDIYNVTDKRAPKKIGSYRDTLRNHIWECVLDCDYAYGGTGTILDLSDPTKPAKIGDWTTTPGVEKPTGFHSIEEVAPGLVVTGSNPMLYLDAREDPTKPVLLASIETRSNDVPRPYLVIGGPPKSVPARIQWPGEAESRFLLVSMESPFSGGCTDKSGSFQTFDTQDGYRIAAEYSVSGNGAYSSGSPPINVFGCSSYAFDANEDYVTNGLVATAWFEHGIRVLRVGDDGALSEAAGFIGYAGNSVRPLWRTEEVLYVLDFNRGLEIFYVDSEDEARDR